MTGHLAPRGATARPPPLPAVSWTCTRSVRLEGLPWRGQVALQAVLAQPAAAAIPPRITPPLGTRGRQARDEGVYERASRTAAATQPVILRTRPWSSRTIQ